MRCDLKLSLSLTILSHRKHVATLPCEICGNLSTSGYKTICFRCHRLRLSAMAYIWPIYNGRIGILLAFCSYIGIIELPRTGSCGQVSNGAVTETETDRQWPLLPLSGLQTIRTPFDLSRRRLVPQQWGRASVGPHNVSHVSTVFVKSSIKILS